MDDLAGQVFTFRDEMLPRLRCVTRERIELVRACRPPKFRPGRPQESRAKQKPSDEIVGTYCSAPYQEGLTPKAKTPDGFTIDLAARTVREELS